MKEPKAPCLGCKDRTAENPELGTHDCHSGCEKYIKYKVDHLEWSKKVYGERMQKLQQKSLTQQRFKEWNKARQKGYIK